MPVEVMSEEELAAFVRDTGTRVVRRSGVHWVEPYPFFFRPLLPLAEIRPERSIYPVRSLLGGVQHVIPDGAPADTCKHHFVFEHPQDYRLAALPH